MEIMQVQEDLVCTRSVKQIEGISLRVMKDLHGKLWCASDPVGVGKGKWVVTAGGSAARWAMPTFDTTTDLTIVGIIDQWDPSKDDKGAKDE